MTTITHSRCCDAGCKKAILIAFGSTVTLAVSTVAWVALQVRDGTADGTLLKAVVTSSKAGALCLVVSSAVFITGSAVYGCARFNNIIKRIFND